MVNRMHADEYKYQGCKYPDGVPDPESAAIVMEAIFVGPFSVPDSCIQGDLEVWN